MTIKATPEQSADRERGYRKHDTRIYTCKHHDHAHPYVVCKICRHQYCDRYWIYCPSCQGADKINRYR